MISIKQVQKPFVLNIWAYIAEFAFFLSHVTGLYL